VTYYSKTLGLVGLWLNVYASPERESALEGRAFVFVDAIQSIEPVPHAGQAILTLENGRTLHVLHSPSYIVDLIKKATP